MKFDLRVAEVISHVCSLAEAIIIMSMSVVVCFISIMSVHSSLCPQAS